MEKLNNIFFALMTRGPDGNMLCFLQGLQSLKTRHWILLFANSSSYCLDGAADISEVSGKEPAEQQQSKKGRGRRQWCLPCSSFPSENSQLGWWIDVIWLLSRQWYTQGILNDLGYFPVQNQNIMLNLLWILHDQWNTQSLTTFFAHVAFVFWFPYCGGLCQDNMHDLNVILCAAYVDPRYFAEYTDYGLV